MAVKRSDVPVLDVLLAHREYRAETDAALVRRGATTTLQSFTALMDPGFPRAPLPYQRLMAAGFPYKVVMARIMQLVDKGLLEYGVSPQTGWLTPAGRTRLSELETAR